MISYAYIPVTSSYILPCISSIFQDHLVYHQHLQIAPSWLCPPKEPSKIDSMQLSISEVQQLPMTFEMCIMPTKRPSFHSTLILKAVIRWPKIPLSRNLYVENEECILLHFDPLVLKDMDLKHQYGGWRFRLQITCTSTGPRSQKDDSPIRPWWSYFQTLQTDRHRVHLNTLFSSSWEAD